MKKIGRVLLILLSTLVLIACQPEIPTSPTNTPLPVSTSTLQSDTPTPIIPTATALPLAASVNSEGITLVEYQAELARYEASGLALNEEVERQVLDQLIDQHLLAYAAQQNGFELDDNTLQQRLDKLIDEAGGQSVFQKWLGDNLYTEQSFKKALERSAAAAWMRDQIAASVPLAVEHVHVRQILLDNETQASQILAQIQAGADFNTLAARQDPVMAGDLGWFPKGYLPEPALDEAAFSLQPGEVSGIIETNLGFHILLLIEKEPERNLDTDALFVLQAKAVRDWLINSRSQSEIKIHLP